MESRIWLTRVMLQGTSEQKIGPRQCKSPLTELRHESVYQTNKSSDYIIFKLVETLAYAA